MFDLSHIGPRQAPVVCLRAQCASAVASATVSFYLLCTLLLHSETILVRRIEASARSARRMNTVHTVCYDNAQAAALDTINNAYAGQAACRCSLHDVVE